MRRRNTYPGSGSILRPGQYVNRPSVLFEGVRFGQKSATDRIHHRKIQAIERLPPTMNDRQQDVQLGFRARDVEREHNPMEATMSSLNKAVSSGIAVLAVTATLFAGSAPAQARDGRNAALISGLVVGAFIGGALASEAQAYEPAPAYRSYYRYPAYHSYHSYPAYEGYGYDRYDYVTPPRYRNCDHDYRSISDWDDDE